MRPKNIDLHVHTTNSDGRETTCEIIEKAVEQGVDIIPDLIGQIGY